MLRAKTIQMKLVWPSLEYLPSYAAALKRGWSSDNERGEVAAQEELEKIATDANVFLASLVDKNATGGPITLPDGMTSSAAAWVSPVALGRRVLRCNRTAVAAWDRAAPSSLSWPHRLRRCALEARPWLCQACSARNAPRSTCRGPSLRGAHDRSG